MFSNIFEICHTKNVEFLHDLKSTSIPKRSSLDNTLHTELDMNKWSEQMIRSMVDMLFKYNELLEKGLNLNPNQKKTLTKNYLKLKNGLQQFKNENQQNSQTLNMIMSEIIAKRKDNGDQETKLHKPFKWG